MTKSSNRGKKIFGDVVAYTVLIIAVSYTHLRAHET